MVDKDSGSDFSNQFFLAVRLCAEERGLFQSVQPAFVPGAVGQFVEDGAVELCCFCELLAVGDNHCICRRLIVVRCSILARKSQKVVANALHNVILTSVSLQQKGCWV